ncbi:hypothetical protein [Catenulispora subtropica]|uniref:Uncharacterized protein n=1 Tax=Catenulispora subtropica TaxID=450798 RepID=A0ABP5D0D7_9ACTN
MTGPLAEAGLRPGADSGDPRLGLLEVVAGPVGDVGVWSCRPGGWPVTERSDTEVCFVLSRTATALSLRLY